LTAVPAGEPGRVAPARAPRDGGSSRLSRPADAKLAAWVFAALVAACFAALIVTQRLKHTPTAVERFMLTSRVLPGAAGALGEERIAFQLTSADRVTVTVQASSGEQVATLVSGVPVGRYRTLSLRWDGRRGAARGYGVLRKADGYTTLVPRIRGPIAPPGEYSIRVYLARQKRSIPSTRTFKLVAP
jgi:hypothetical protein